jgi:hypothetical protein
LKRRVVLVGLQNSDATGAAIYARWIAPRARELRRVAIADVQTRDGWAVGETKKRTGDHRGDDAAGDERTLTRSDVEEEHRQQHQREDEQTTAADHF